MKKADLQNKLNNLGITYKKRDTVEVLKNKLEYAHNQICFVIKHHEKYSKSYFWSKDNGNNNK